MKQMWKLLLRIVVCSISVTALAEPEEETWAIELRKVTLRVNPDYTYEEIEEETTLIRSQAIVDSFGQDDYVYSSDSESVEVLEAYTVLPNGEIVEVESDKIRTTVDQTEDGEASYSDDHHKIIIYPNLVAGARTHYKIKKTVHTPLYPDRFLEAYYYHPDVEYLDAQVHLEFPSELPIKVETRGPVAVSKIEENSLTKYSFSFSQRELKTMEDGDVSWGDISSAIFISSFKDYADFAEVYRARSEPKALVTPEIQALADELTQNVAGRREKAHAIYNWVATNIRYVGVYFGDGGVVPHTSVETLRNLHGDCKDKSNLLIALLKAVGIEAENALINSGSSYALPPLPVHNPINHVITYIPEFDLFADATDDRAPFGILDYSVLGKPAILEKSGRVVTTPLDTKESTRSITHVTLDIDKDGYIHGAAKTQFFGGKGKTARGFFDFSDNDDKKETINAYFSKFLESGVGDFVAFGDVRALIEPMWMESTYVLDPVSNVPGPGAMRIPVGLAPGSINKLSHYRPSSDSTFPYLCGSESIEENYEISFPEGVRITHIPQSVDVTEGANTYRASYEQVSPSLIKIQRVFISDRDTMLCPSEEYDKWAKLFPVIRRDVISQIFYE
jgi:transglutaminase-like putative cysteine protease